MVEVMVERFPLFALLFPGKKNFTTFADSLSEKKAKHKVMKGHGVFHKTCLIIGDRRLCALTL